MSDREQWQNAIMAALERISDKTVEFVDWDECGGQFETGYQKPTSPAGEGEARDSVARVIAQHISSIEGDTIRFSGPRCEQPDPKATGRARRRVRVLARAEAA